MESEVGREVARRLNLMAALHDLCDDCFWDQVLCCTDGVSGRAGPYPVLGSGDPDELCCLPVFWHDAAKVSAN